MSATLVGTAQTGSNGTPAASFIATLATAGPAVGDYDLIVTNVQGAGVTIATPTGWALLASSSDNNVDLRLFARFRQAGDPTTVAMSLTGGTSAYSWESAALNGVHPSTQTGTPQSAATSIASTTLTVPSLTTTGTGSYRLALAGIGSGATSFDTMPAGYTQIQQATTGKRSVLAGAANASPTTTGALSFTVSAAQRGTVTHIEILAAGAATVTVPAAAATAAAPAPTVEADTSLATSGSAAVTAAAPAPTINLIFYVRPPAASVSVAAPASVIRAASTVVTVRASAAAGAVGPRVINYGGISFGPGTATIRGTGRSTSSLTGAGISTSIVIAKGVTATLGS